MADDDLGRIEVQLSLLSAQDSKAARDLADSLKGIAEMFKVINAGDFMDNARKTFELAKTLQSHDDSHRKMTGGDTTEALTRAVKELTTTVQEAKKALADVGGAPRQGQGGTSSGGQDEVRKRAEKNREEDAKKAKEEKDKYTRHIDKYEDSEQHLTDRELRSNEELRRINRERKKSGLDQYPLLGTKEREDLGEGHFLNQVPLLSGQPGPETRIDIPRFGQLNIQDYLKAAREATTRYGARWKGQDGPRGTIGNTSARIAPTLGRMVGYAGYGFTALQAAKFARGALESSGFDPWHNADLGGQLGFERGGSFLGIQDPTSAAAGEGRRQTFDRYGLRMQGGINKEQASQIVEATAGAGFSGNTAHDISYNILAPLMKKYGLDPQTIVPFLGAVRTGQSSVGELSNSLKGLGNTARATNLTLPQLTQQLQGVVDVVTQQGGSTVQGIQLGQRFGRATGVTPDVAGQLLQSPMVQGELALETGGLPGLQAGLPDEVVIGAQLRTIDQVKALIPDNTVRVTDPRTGKYSPEFSRIQAQALRAQLMGIPLAQYQQLEKNVKTSAAKVGLDSHVDKYEHTFRTNRNQEIDRLLHKQVGDDADPSKPIDYNQKTGEISYTNKHGRVRHVKEDTDLFSHNLGQKASDFARRQGDPEWDRLVKYMEGTGIWGGKTPEEKKARADKVLKDDNFTDEADPAKRIEKLHKEIDKQTKRAKSSKDEDQQVKVAFTGLAEQMLRVAGRGSGDTGDYNYPTSANEAATPPGRRPLNNRGF